jgi:Arf-GAP/SH3 domain/ANK repeat/PH domain-containing protein
VLVKLQNEDELIFHFTFVIRRSAEAQESSINGLTFMFAGNYKDLDNLVTKELQADPNLHKNNPNVELLGDYSTTGSASVQFQWTWKWKPPKSEERGLGWRNCCSVRNLHH